MLPPLVPPEPKVVPLQPTAAPFGMFQVRRKEPPYFNGQLDEDVETWLYGVQDYARLLGADGQAMLNYAATLLQKDAKDWWISLQKNNRRPGTFMELWDKMVERFGTPMKADKAHIALIVISQGPSELVWSYTNRFSHWVGKLPSNSMNDPWLMDLYYDGLHTSIAELLLMVPNVSALEATMREAERIETRLTKARRRKPSTYKSTTAKSMQSQGQVKTRGHGLWHGRGSFRGRTGYTPNRPHPGNSSGQSSKMQAGHGKMQVYNNSLL